MTWTWPILFRFLGSSDYYNSFAALKLNCGTASVEIFKLSRRRLKLGELSLKLNSLFVGRRVRGAGGHVHVSAVRHALQPRPRPGPRTRHVPQHPQLLGHGAALVLLKSC